MEKLEGTVSYIIQVHVYAYITIHVFDITSIKRLETLSIPIRAMLRIVLKRRKTPNISRELKDIFKPILGGLYSGEGLSLGDFVFLGEGLIFGEHFVLVSE